MNRKHNRLLALQVANRAAARAIHIIIDQPVGNTAAHRIMGRGRSMDDAVGKGVGADANRREQGWIAGHDAPGSWNRMTRWMNACAQADRSASPAASGR